MKKVARKIQAALGINPPVAPTWVIATEAVMSQFDKNAARTKIQNVDNLRDYIESKTAAMTEKDPHLCDALMQSRALVNLFLKNRYIDFQRKASTRKTLQQSEKADLVADLGNGIERVELMMSLRLARLSPMEMKYAVLCADGLKPSEAQKELGLTRYQRRQIEADIRSKIHAAKLFED